MVNSWLVIWYEGGKKLKKNGFDGDSPRASGAIDYAKKVIARGIPAANVHVVSKRKAFGPTPAMRAKQEPGTSWCPYCLKWRTFRIFAIRWHEVVIPPDYRCPICTISVADHYVQLYNPVLFARATTVPVRVGKPNTEAVRRTRRER